MDRIDNQIVHCLLLDGRASFDRIGKVVGVSPQTAARRFRSLHEAGVIRIVGTPSASAVGSELWFVNVVCRPGTADQVARALSRRPEVSWVTIVSGGTGVICAVQVGGGVAHGALLLDQLPHATQILRFDAVQVLHRFTSRHGAWSAFPDRPTQHAADALMDLPEPVRPGGAESAALTAEDAVLLDCLAADGRARVMSLSRATGWPSSRVRKRLEQLLGAGALWIEPEVDPSAFGTTTSAFLWLTVAPSALDDVGQTLAEHPEVGFTAAVTGRANLITAVTTAGSEALYHYLHASIGNIAAVRDINVAPVLQRIKRSDSRTGRALLNQRDLPAAPLFAAANSSVRS